jgi:mycothiol synthase
VDYIARGRSSLTRVERIGIARVGDLAWETYANGEVVGAASSHTGSEPSARYVRLTVASAARGQGIGARLFDAVRADGVERGYRTLEGIAVVASDGEAFALRRGATLGDELVDYAVNLAAIDPRRLGSAFPVPDGYEMIAWEGCAPEWLVSSYAAAKRGIRDAPNHHPPVVPDWDSEMVRSAERASLERGVHLWGQAAMIGGSNAVVAFSEIGVPDHRGEASQEDTVVLPDHRRRGLATAVKAGLLTRLRVRRSDITAVGVTCAVANVGMRTVNYRLGFREIRRRNLYRLEVLATAAEPDALR